MANYYSAVRTNYFHVKDEQAFRDFMKTVVGNEEAVSVWSGKDADGNTTFGFGCYNGIAGIKTEAQEGEEDQWWPDYDYDAFLNALSKHVADDDAIIIFESGNEKLRYVVGQAVVITSHAVELIDMWQAACEQAADMLGNPEWKTVCDY